MSWRQPAPRRRSASAASASASRRLPAEAGSRDLRTRDAAVASACRRKQRRVCDFIDVPRTETLQEVGRAQPVELRIRRLDRQEEALVAGDLGEARHVEHRVIRHRQPAQQDPAEHRRERREQDRQLEGHRDERRPAVERPSADVQRIGDRRDPVASPKPATMPKMPPTSTIALHAVVVRVEAPRPARGSETASRRPSSDSLPRASSASPATRLVGSGNSAIRPKIGLLLLCRVGAHDQCSVRQSKSSTVRSCFSFTFASGTSVRPRRWRSSAAGARTGTSAS